MDLKTSYQSAMAINMEKRAKRLEEVVRLSDEQIQFAKEAITKELCENGSKRMKIPIKVIEFLIDDELAHGLLDSRLERAIGNWLESEGLVASVHWVCPHLKVHIYHEEYNSFRLDSPTVSVRDIANKFEQHCAMKE